MSDIKLGITLFSFTTPYCRGEMTFEDCVRTAKEIGAEGFEIVLAQMVPSYPFVSDKFLGELQAITRNYDIDLICCSGNVDRGLRGDRNLTEDEMLQRAITDIKSVHKMGCKILKEQYLITPGVMTKLVPYAEAYDVKVGIEIHNPETPNTPYMREYLAAFQQSGSKYIGFVPDFGLFATAPNKPMWDRAIAAGTPVELLEMAKEMRLSGVPLDEAMGKLAAAGANGPAFGALQGMYGFVQFKKDCKAELEGLKEIMPYSFHMHGKCHYVSEDLKEGSIPYHEILPVIAASDYEGYIVTEYEDEKGGDSIEMTKRHLNMMKKILGR